MCVVRTLSFQLSSSIWEGFGVAQKVLLGELMGESTTRRLAITIQQYSRAASNRCRLVPGALHFQPQTLRLEGSFLLFLFCYVCVLYVLLVFVNDQAVPRLLAQFCALFVYFGSFTTRRYRQLPVCVLLVFLQSVNDQAAPRSPVCVLYLPFIRPLFSRTVVRFVNDQAAPRLPVCVLPVIISVRNRPGGTLGTRPDQRRLADTRPRERGGG